MCWKEKGIFTKKVNATEKKSNCARFTKAAATDTEKHIRNGSYVIALDVKGKGLSSEQLAQKIDQLGVQGMSDVVFIIGGSLGLSQKLLDRADFKLSFSAMTFPHQMMRVILLEQVYRAFKINRNEAYHK